LVRPVSIPIFFSSDLFFLTNIHLDAFFYDIYTHISELHLVSVGLEVEWSDVDVAADDDRWGRSREYFSLPIYRLPLGRMKLI
jgi:protein arginine N-methyltransferase 2